MKKSYLFLLFTIFLLGKADFLFSQHDVRIKRRDFRTEQEGFKEAWKNIKIANDYYDQGIGTYRLARHYYLRAYEYNQDNAELNLKIGLCYLFTDDKFEAINYLSKAYELKENVSFYIHYLLGRAYHLVHNFDEAITEYNNYRRKLTRRETKVDGAYINKLIEECRHGKQLLNEPVRVIIRNLGENINSEYDDYIPLLLPGDTVMYFTSRRKVDEKSKRTLIDYKFNENIYVADKVNGEWQEASILPKPVNDKFNNAVVEIFPDGKTMYIYHGKKGGNLKVTTFNENKGNWRKPRKVSSRFRTRSQESSFTMTADSSTIYFVSDDPRHSIGGKDIFVSHRKPRGGWAKAENLGNVINTPYNEEGVYVTPGGDTLYFSSQGHNSMGGYDIFRSVLNRNGKWSRPENLGYPINSADDDLFYHPSTTNEKIAYFTTIREVGIGEKDIFKIIFLGTEKELIFGYDEVLTAGIVSPPKSMFFEPPQLIAIDTSIIVQGRIFDDENNASVVARIQVIDSDINQIIATSVSDTAGAYRIKIPSRKTYGFEIVATDYLFFVESINFAEEPDVELIIKDFPLTRIEVGARMILKNIFFETGKSTLMPTSYAELDNVVKFMESHRRIRLEISGHTDNVGSLRLNTRLSESRAQAVVDYLVSRGIDASRLESKGYAFSQPIAPNTTSEGRALNRRVEFKVISK